MAFALIMMLLFVPLIVLSVGVTVWWIIVLVEVVKVPEQAWQAAGQDRIVFLLVVLLGGAIGALIYVLVARPRLRAVGALA